MFVIWRKLLGPAIITLFLLPAASCSEEVDFLSFKNADEPTAQVSQKNGRYEIEQGADDPMCQKYATHLEALPPQSSPPEKSCLPPLPIDSAFSAIEFETLDPLEHMEIVKEMGFAYEGLLSVAEKAEISACEGDQDCLDHLWVERDWLLARAMRNIESGIYILRRAQFDLNGDGKTETVYQHRNTRRTTTLSPKPKLPLCTVWGEQGVRERDLNLIVRESDDPALHKRYREATFFGDVARYDGQVFLVRSGRLGVTLFYAGKEETGNAANMTMACTIRPK